MKKRLFISMIVAAMGSVLIFAVLILLLGNSPTRLIAAAIAAGILAVILANTIAKRFIHSIRSIDPHRPDASRTYEELAPILRRLQTQNETIRVQQEALAHHQEDRDSMRREFTANVSHELKTPLTSISGFAELMKEENMPSETVREFAGDIYREAQRMIALVDDIMHLSRLDENSVPLERTEVDLHAVACRAAQRLAMTAKKSDVTLVTEGSPVTITGVEMLLEEIVFNLTENAIKYNRPGGSVTVSVQRSGGHAELIVSDTGIGIPEEHQSRVFERFYRVDKSHSREVGGTGLGLSIVKHAAAYHDAAVFLESTADKGTTVKVLFGV